MATKCRCGRIWCILSLRPANPSEILPPALGMEALGQESAECFMSTGIICGSWIKRKLEAIAAGPPVASRKKRDLSPGERFPAGYFGILNLANKIPLKTSDPCFSFTMPAQRGVTVYSANLAHNVSSAWLVPHSTRSLGWETWHTQQLKLWNAHTVQLCCFKSQMFSWRVKHTPAQKSSGISAQINNKKFPC